jgi:hypothetical protein
VAHDCTQAYEGLQTAHKLKQEYTFLPAKLKEVYLTYLLEHLEDHKVLPSEYAHCMHKGDTPIHTASVILN